MNSNIKLLTTALTFGTILTVLSPVIISDSHAYTTGCVEYKPLQRGPSREDMSLEVRGICKRVAIANNPEFSISVIAPERLGKTFTSQLPSLYWWVSHPVNASFRFTWIRFTDDGKPIDNTLKETMLKLSVKAGIQKFPLDKLIGKKVLTEAQYNWSVRLLCKPPNTVGEDRFISGMIMYEKPTNRILSRLEKTNNRALPCVCIENGFWYDAFDKVQQLLQDKYDKEFRELRLELLEKEGLHKVLIFHSK